MPLMVHSEWKSHDSNPGQSHSRACTLTRRILLPPFSWDPKMLSESGFEVSDSTVGLWKAFLVDSGHVSPSFMAMADI